MKLVFRQFLSSLVVVLVLIVSMGYPEGERTAAAGN